MKPGKIFRFFPVLGLSFFIVFHYNGILSAQKKYIWDAISGRWERYQLDNGNMVMRQGWSHDREKSDSPTPLLQFKTIRIHPKIKDPSGADSVSLKFNVQNFYSSSGELAVFFGGKSEKEVYYIQLQFHSQFIYSISLVQSLIKNADLPMKAFGNYYTKNLASSYLSVPTNNLKLLRISRSENQIKVFLDNTPIFNYTRTKATPLTYFPDTFFAVGSRGAHLWIDDIIISRKGKILFQDDFSTDMVKRYYFENRKAITGDKSTPTSPR